MLQITENISYSGVLLVFTTPSDLQGHDSQNSMTSLTVPNSKLWNIKYPTILHAMAVALDIWLRGTMESVKCWIDYSLINSLHCIIAADGSLSNDSPVEMQLRVRYYIRHPLRRCRVEFIVHKLYISMV